MTRRSSPEKLPRTKSFSKPYNDPLRHGQNGGLICADHVKVRYTTVVCRFTRFKSIKQAITIGRMADSEDEEIPPERDVKVVFKLTL